MKTTKLKLPWKIIEVVDDPHFTDPFYERDNFVKLWQEQWPLEKRVVIDVGAHQGIYSSFFAAILGYNGFIYAFEPNPVNWPLLLKNITPDFMQAFVAVYPFALGRILGAGNLRCWEDKPGATGQGQLTLGDPCDYEINVHIRPLDSLSFPCQIEFIKIDVEHCEWDVISGAINTILEHRPRMLVEVHNNESREQIKMFCRVHRFEVEEWKASIPSVNQVSEYLFIRP